MPHKALQYLIANWNKTKFFAFGGPSYRRWSEVTDNAALAYHFPSRESAGEIIQEGQLGRWGTITEHQLNCIYPITVEVTVK